MLHCGVTGTKTRCCTMHALPIPLMVHGTHYARIWYTWYLDHVPCVTWCTHDSLTISPACLYLSPQPGDPWSLALLGLCLQVDETDVYVDNEQQLSVADADLDCDLPDT